MKTIDAMKQLVCAWDEMMATHRPSALFEHVSALREAIAREEAQTVEPAFYVPPERNEYHSRDFVSASRTEKAGWVPLFTRPAPATEPAKTSGEREVLIRDLRSYIYDSPTANAVMRLAAAMLAADAQEIAGWRVEQRENMDSMCVMQKEINDLKAQQVAVPQGVDYKQLYESLKVSWRTMRNELVELKPESFFHACLRDAVAKENGIEAAPQPPQADEPCHCDKQGIGKPGVTCGDCPRDYLPTQAAPRAPMTQKQFEELVTETDRASRLGDWATHLARLVEQFHGIGVKP